MAMSTDNLQIPKAKIQGWANELLALEDQIKALNDAKSAIYKRAKAEYNAAVKDGLRVAVGMVRKDPGKRLQAETANAYAALFVTMIEGQDAPAHVHEEPDAEPLDTAAEPGFEAWRERREVERAAPFEEDADHDPETGEILEPDHHGEQPTPSSAEQARRSKEEADRLARETFLQSMMSRPRRLPDMGPNSQH